MKSLPIPDTKHIQAYLPDQAISILNEWLMLYPCILKLAPGRKTKLGDFRSAEKGNLPSISVNRTLHPYAFLITLIHELAHVKTWMEFGYRAKPHGDYWKANYRLIGISFLDHLIFPSDIEKAFRKSLAQPGASSTRDEDLRKTLNRYNPCPAVYLQELEQDAVFSTLNGKFYVKGSKRSKRYVCKSLDNGQKYLFHPLTEVNLKK